MIVIMWIFIMAIAATILGMLTHASIHFSIALTKIWEAKLDDMFEKYFGITREEAERPGVYKNYWEK